MVSRKYNIPCLRKLSVCQLFVWNDWFDSFPHSKMAFFQIILFICIHIRACPYHIVLFYCFVWYKLWHKIAVYHRLDKSIGSTYFLNLKWTLYHIHLYKFICIHIIHVQFILFNFVVLCDFSGQKKFTYITYYQHKWQPINVIILTINTLTIF